MYTDADIEMIEMRNAGNDIANGVCPRCDDMLDPMAPKWDNDPIFDRCDREGYAKSVGPHSNVVEGYHDLCIESPDFW